MVTKQTALMSITSYNGSALVAMVGKNCFAMASDRPFRRLRLNASSRFMSSCTLASQVLPQTCRQCLLPFVKMPGVDAASVFSDTGLLVLFHRLQRLNFRHKLYQLREQRNMRLGTFASLFSDIIYEKRFGPYLCESVIAELNDDGKPFIYTTDLISAKQLAKNFVVSGIASESL